MMQMQITSTATAHMIEPVRRAADRYATPVKPLTPAVPRKRHGGARILEAIRDAVAAHEALDAVTHKHDKTHGAEARAGWRKSTNRIRTLCNDWQAGRLHVSSHDVREIATAMVPYVSIWSMRPAAFIVSGGRLYEGLMPVGDALRSLKLKWVAPFVVNSAYLARGLEAYAPIRNPALYGQK
jgi:hypothetical protein